MSHVDYCDVVARRARTTVESYEVARHTLVTALMAPSVGITTMASVSGYDKGVLTETFRAGMTDLIAKVKAADTTKSVLADAAEETRFTSAIRMALAGESEIHKKALSTAGVTVAAPTAQIILGGEHGDLVVPTKEIEELMMNGGAEMDEEPDPFAHGGSLEAAVEQGRGL